VKVLLLDLEDTMRGGQRQIFYLARCLSRMSDFTPLVAMPKNAPLATLLDQADLPYEPLPSSSDYNPLNTVKLRKIIKAFQPDIVHTNDTRGASLGALAKKLNNNFKLVHCRRVSYKLKSGWDRKKYQHGDALVATSREIQEVLVSCGIPQKKTRTIHSGIDARMYTTEHRRHPVLTIGAVGALSEQKGFEVLIEALAELRSMPSMPDWQCMIAGDGPLRQELKQLAENLNLTSKILFLRYRDSREVLPEMDILTIPSIDGEGSNAVIKEGWATRTPVITSDLPSNLELVTHNKDGLVFKNRNAGELAAAIVRLATDQKTTDVLVDNGAKSVARYTDQIMADQYATLYKQLVG